MILRARLVPMLWVVSILVLFVEVKATPAEPRKRIKQVEYAPPVARIYEVDQSNRILRPWTKINENFETTLENVDRIRLECTSDVHPVQWLYLGYGAPTLTSNVTFSRIKGGDETSTEYVATALISPTKEHHTGKYICSRTDSFDARTYFYIYVPGPTLFAALNGQDMYIPKNDSNILFPCTVSNPDVIVTLEKSINDVLQRVKPSLVKYDPKEGMRLNIAEIDDPEGIYVCTARYNNLVRGIEYTLRYPSSTSNFGRVIPEKIEAENSGATCDQKCGDNAHCEVTRGGQTCVCNHLFEGDPNDACNLECHSHSDCPSGTVCFRDLKCRDPCVHSIRCGEGALCRVENSFPVCYCPQHFVGDPMTGCVNSIQSDASYSPLNSTSPRCDRKPHKDPAEGCEISCKSHDECPDDLSCNTLLRCHSPCVHNIRCGTGAACRVIKHRPQCYCPKDSAGDPMKECGSEYQGDQPPSSSPPDSPSAPPTNPKENKCRSDQECASHEKCMRPGVGQEKQCTIPCATRRCGAGALCKTEDHRTFCACKDGFEGNANKECSPIKYEEGGVEPLRRPQPSRQHRRPVNCSKPEECGPFSKCTLDKDGKQQCACLEGHIGAPPKCAPQCDRNADCALSHVCLRDSRLEFPYCAKLCGRKICGANANCREQNGVIAADCECPIGFGGDPYLHCKNLNDNIGIDCTMDHECGSTLRCETGADYRKCVDPCETLQCSENLECSVQDHQATCICPAGHTGNPSIGCTRDAEFNSTFSDSPCGRLSCGPHSECRMESGEPTCACRSYARGEPPSCYEECQSNSDCELGLSCVQRRCKHSCSRCGVNTKCLISRIRSQDSVCSCLDGFEGNPQRGCTPIKA